MSPARLARSLCLALAVATSAAGSVAAQTARPPQAPAAQAPAAPDGPLRVTLQAGQATGRIPGTDLACDAVRRETRPIVTCRVRFDDPTPIQGARAVERGTSREWTTAVGTIDPREDDDTAFLILVDRTDPRRVETLRRIARDLGEAFGRPAARQKVAVASFGTSFDVLQDFTNDGAAIGPALARIRADFAAGEIFAATVEGVRRLEAVPTSRRVLVLASDGRSEDRAVTAEAAVGAARRAGVRVLALGYAERAADLPDLEPLRRLATETRGAYVEASPVSRELAPDVRAGLATRFTGGGIVRIEGPPRATANVVDLTLRLSENRSLSVIATLAPGGATPAAPPAPAAQAPTSAPAPATPPAPTTTAPQPAPPPQATPAAPAAPAEPRRETANWERDVAVALIVGSLVLGIAFAIVGPMRRSRTRRRGEPPREVARRETTPVLPVPAPPAPAPAPEPAVVDAAVDTAAPAEATPAATPRPFAWLDFESEVQPMLRRTVTIGRHPDDAIRIDDLTVSRRHADLWIDPRGRFALRNRTAGRADRPTSPILVNGREVEAAELSDGDRVHLGNVSFTFRTQPAAR